MIAEATDDLVRANLKAETRKAYHRMKATTKRRLKYRVFARDEYRCVYCGLNLSKDMSTFLAATVDHVKPLNAAGSNDEDNLVSACHICNALKAGTACLSLAEAREIVLTRRAELVVKVMKDLSETGIKFPDGTLEEDATLKEAVQVELLSTLAGFSKKAKKLSASIDGIAALCQNVETSLAKNRRPRRSWWRWLFA